MKHGMVQQFNAKAGSFTFQAQRKKKNMVASATLGQLRVRFPQYAHLPEADLRRMAEKELL
jgi:hypothetical protein